MAKDDEPRSAVTVIDTSARIIEGELMLKSALTWKPRYFVLRNGRLQYFGTRGEARVRGELELGEGARVVECDRRPHAIQARRGTLSRLSVCLLC